MLIVSVLYLTFKLSVGPTCRLGKQIGLNSLAAPSASAPDGEQHALHLLSRVQFAHLQLCLLD